MLMSLYPRTGGPTVAILLAIGQRSPLGERGSSVSTFYRHGNRILTTPEPIPAMSAAKLDVRTSFLWQAPVAIRDRVSPSIEAGCTWACPHRRHLEQVFHPSRSLTCEQ